TAIAEHQAGMAAIAAVATGRGLVVAGGVGSGATCSAVPEKADPAAVSALAVVHTGDAVAASATHAEEQAAAATVLAGPAVGPATEQQAGVLAGLVAVADVELDGGLDPLLEWRVAWDPFRGVRSRGRGGERRDRADVSGGV